MPLVLVLAVGPLLEEPWGCGDEYMVTQGNNTTFSHQGMEAFAWDFDLDEGMAIHAAAGGTVSRIRMDSMQGGCDSSFGNDANYVVIDHGDGTGGLYLHLAPFSSPLELGDSVETGDFIGRVGLTGWVCGDHLHFQVQELCDSWYCQSVNAEFADHGVPQFQDWLPSDNCPDCAADLDGAETLVHEHDFACFEGMEPSWTTSTAGEGAHHFHVAAHDGGAAVATGTWRFGVSVPGDYAVSVHVPEAQATASQATYVVHHAEGSDDITIDQNAIVGWTDLGVYPFAGAGDERVELADNTGDAPGDGRRLAYDVIRFEHVASPGDDDDDDDATGGGTGDDDDDDDDDASGDDDDDDSVDDSDGGMGDDDDDASGDDDDDAASGGGGTGGDALPGGLDRDDEDGCACRASRRGDDLGPALFVLGLGLVGVRRRRGLA